MGTQTNFIEKLVMMHMISSALEQGYSLTVNDGETIVLLRSTDPKAILAAMHSTDEEYVYFHRADAKGGPYDVFRNAENYDDALAVEADDETDEVQQPHDFAGYVYLVYGNSGYDVISDYVSKLDEVLKPTNDFCDQIDNGDVAGYLAYLPKIVERFADAKIAA